jgi:hypothetical protein
MNSKLSILKSVVVSAALAASVSGTALADESSKNPVSGDSTSPVFDNAPSAWRQSHPNGLSINQIAAMSTPVFKPAPVLDNAPSAWRQSHPNGLSFNQIAAMSTPVFKPAPVLDNAPSAWRQNHPDGLAHRQFAAMGSEAIAARPSSDQATVPASTNAVADTASGSREPIATRIARFFRITPASQATRSN